MPIAVIDTETPL